MTADGDNLLRRAWRGWLRSFEATGSVRALAVLRMFLGPIVLVDLWPFWQGATPETYFAHGFFVPFFEHWPVLDLSTYRVALGLAMGSAVAMSLGVFTRLACAVTLAFVSFSVLSNQFFFHHNRAFLMTVLFGLTLLPSGQVLSVDAWWARRRGRPLEDAAPLWRLYLFRCLACVPYLASGFSKLIDPDWWGGVVMMDRIGRYRHIAEARGVPAALIDPIASPGFNAVLWKLVVLSELFVGLGYWFRSTRVAAMVTALVFHALIEVTSKVSVFSFLGVAATLVWVTPKTRDRVLRLRLDTPAGQRLHRRVQRHDWLARFDVQLVKDGPGVALTDRDSAHYEGRDAEVLVLSRLPLWMPLFAPRWILRTLVTEVRRLRSEH